MKLRLVIVAAVALAAPAYFAHAEDEVRVYQLRYRPARDAAGLVEPLLSDTGSLLLQPKSNTLTVRDERAVLDRVAKAVAVWDVPPSAYRVLLRVLLASMTAPVSGPAFGPGFGVDDWLLKVLKYKSFEEVDALAVTAVEGTQVEASLGQQYEIRFTLRAGILDSERVILSKLQFSRREKSESGSEVLSPLLRSTVSLKLGQTGVVGAAQSEEASQALVLVLRAQREDKP